MRRTFSVVLLAAACVSGPAVPAMAQPATTNTTCENVRNEYQLYLARADAYEAEGNYSQAQLWRARADVLRAEYPACF